MSDPYAAQVYLLCNFDGTHGATSYTSERGPDPDLTSFSSQAVIDTGVSYFAGGGSVYLNNTAGTFVRFGANADWNWLHNDTEDWTIEIIFRPTDNSLTTNLVDTYNSSNLSGWRVFVGGGAVGMTSNNSGGAGVTGITINNWWYFVGTYTKATNTIAVKKFNTAGSSTSATGTATVKTTDSLLMQVGNNRANGVRFKGYIDSIRITRGVARTITAWPTEPWSVDQPFTCLMQAPFALSRERYVGFNNFSSVVAGFSRPGVTVVKSQYYMQLSGTPTLTIPISSWQATRQLDRTQYLQCVVPAVDDYVSLIAARQGSSTFTIYRTATLPNGYVHSVKVAESLLESAAFSEGGMNYSCTLSGYPAGASAPTIPATYELAGVRYIEENSTGTYSARCAIDWLLRPGDTVSVDEITFTADYINYYANDRDSYMDVGSR